MLTTLAYGPSDQAVPNPERGFFVHIDLLGGWDLATVRAQGYTLGHATVRLDAYRDSALPAELLAALTAGFAGVRRGGMKVVLRFAYNDRQGDADADQDQILAHIAQLAPILRADADVIAVLEAGFIGAWGEWHHSTHRLDRAARTAILAALLEALPASRSVMVRRPTFKHEAYGGPLEASGAYDGSPASRVGHLNDCFLATAADWGTYRRPIERWKAYVAADGRYTPVGGETCRLNPPRTDCARALAELSRLHWSFLNAGYHPDVLARWEAQGCRERIARELGYRFELESVVFAGDARPGDTLPVTISLVNRGYAAMFNARPVVVLLDERAVATGVDPRHWQPGVPVSFTVEVPIGADVLPGRHRLALWLPDADPRLRAPGLVDAYSVRFANADWAAPCNVLTDALPIGLAC